MNGKINNKIKKETQLRKKKIKCRQKIKAERKKKKRKERFRRESGKNGDKKKGNW